MATTMAICETTVEMTNLPNTPSLAFFPLAPPMTAHPSSQPKRGTKVAPAPANPALRPITSSTSLSPSTVSARPSPPDATHPVPSPPASAASLPPDSQQTYLHGPGVAVPAHPEPSVNQGPSARSHFAGTSPPAQRASSVTSRAAPRAAASAESAAGWGGEQGSSGPTPSPPRGRPLGLRGRGGGEGSLEGSTADLGDGYDAHKRAETNADAAMQAPRAVGAKAALPKGVGWTTPGGGHERLAKEFFTRVDDFLLSCLHF